MTRVIGVRFRIAGKIYYFEPGDYDVKRGSHVIVETARGIEYGTVVGEPMDVEDDKVVKPIKPILRIADSRDEEQEAANRFKEKDAFKICQEKINKHGLEMKLIDAEYTFDNNKILFYFTADGRIDFRALVKDLAAVFRTRIELRQIGVRDETKIIGGYGICGRPLCCHTYLADFAPVSIKMAKEQSLSLNPTKISGVCGRLMCCLKNEEEVYEELNRKLPKVGDVVITKDNLEGEVASVSVLRQTVKILVDVDDEKEVHEYLADEVRFLRKKAKHRENNLLPDYSQMEGEIDTADLKALEDSGTSGNLDVTEGGTLINTPNNAGNRKQHRNSDRNFNKDSRDNRDNNKDNTKDFNKDGSRDFSRDNKPLNNNRENDRNFAKDNVKDVKDNGKDNSNGRDFNKGKYRQNFNRQRDNRRRQFNNNGNGANNNAGNDKNS